MRIAVACLVCLAAAPAFAADGGETTAQWEAWSRERVDTLVRHGEYEDAIDETFVLAQLRPTDPGPLAQGAVIAVEADYMREKPFSSTSVLYKIAERAVRDASARGGIGDARIAYAIGRLRYADGKWGAAWRAFKQAKEQGFEPVRARFWFYRASVNRAALLVQSNRAIDAVADLEELDRLMPDHPDRNSLRINLAAAHHMLMEPGVAKKYLTDALRDDPRSAQATYLLGTILGDEGRLEDSLAKLREARALAGPDYGGSTWSDALVRECETLIKLGRLDEAEAAAQMFGSVKKDDPQALFALGRVYHARNGPGDADRAVKLFRRVARALPDAVDSLNGLKQVLYELHEDAEAAEVQKHIDQIRSKREAEISGEMGTMGVSGSKPAKLDK